MSVSLRFARLESEQLTPYFVFSEEEVKALCQRFGMDYDSVQKWYDGYNISGQHIYNPNAVYEAMARHRLASYRKDTSSFQTIAA